MRLLLVNSAWPESWGGGEKWTVEAAEWFRKQRHQAAVCARPDSLLAQAAKRHKLETIETPFGGDFDPFAVRRAKRILNRYRPDCVLVNFNKEAWQFGFAARSQKIPLLARHGFPLLRPKLSHRYLLKHLIAGLVVNADSIRDGYLADGLDASSEIVVHNGVKAVEPERGELRRHYRIANDDLLVLAAGRLESQKRFDRVIEIAHRLCPANPRLRFLILGSGPLRDSLQAQVDAGGLHETVRIGHFVRNFAGLTGDADLFLLTSDSEGSPNALLEAMAAGVCCLATPAGAVPQIFGDKFTAQLLQGDSERMVEQVAEILKDGARRKQIGLRMCEHVLSEFSFEKSMRQYEQIIAELVVRRS